MLLHPHPGPWEARWMLKPTQPWPLREAWLQPTAPATGMPLDKPGKDIFIPKIFSAAFFRAAGSELNGTDGSTALEIINKMNNTELRRPADICPEPRRNSSVKLLNYYLWLVLPLQSCCSTRGIKK